MKKFNFLKEEHKGIGGLYFIFSATLAATILATIIRLSYSSCVSEIINNSAFIVASDALSTSYINHDSSYINYTGLAPATNLDIDGKYINCNTELRNIIENWVDVSGNITCKLEYEPTYNAHGGSGIGSKITLTFNEIKIKNFDIKIKPTVQEIYIEN